MFLSISVKKEVSNAIICLSDLSAPQLAEEGVQGPGELPQPLGLEPLQLREEQQQHRGPGVTVGLATQREEVADNLEK